MLVDRGNLFQAVEFSLNTLTEVYTCVFKTSKNNAQAARNSKKLYLQGSSPSQNLEIEFVSVTTRWWLLKVPSIVFESRVMKDNSQFLRS